MSLPASLHVRASIHVPGRRRSQTARTTCELTAGALRSAAAASKTAGMLATRSCQRSWSTAHLKPCGVTAGWHTGSAHFVVWLASAQTQCSRFLFSNHLIMALFRAVSQIPSGHLPIDPSYPLHPSHHKMWHGGICPSTIHTCTPIMGAAAATRWSTAASSQECMPPSETPVTPVRAASTSGRVSR